MEESLARYTTIVFELISTLQLTLRTNCVAGLRLGPQPCKREELWTSMKLNLDSLFLVYKCPSPLTYKANSHGFKQNLNLPTIPKFVSPTLPLPQSSRFYIYNYFPDIFTYIYQN